MPYGTQKARDGDPYEWVADRFAQEIGLDESWKHKLAGAALAGTMALGALGSGGAHSTAPADAGVSGTTISNPSDNKTDIKYRTPTPNQGAAIGESSCNMTTEGEYCPEHGLAECGNYGMYESELARIKSLALDEAIMVNPGTTIMNPDTEKMANPELEKHNTWQKQDAEADRIKWGGGGGGGASAPQKSGLAAKPGDVVDVDAKEVEEGDIPSEFVSSLSGKPTTLDVINYKDYTSDMKSNFGQDWKPDPKPTGPYDTAKLGSPRYSQPPVEESRDGDALLARIKSLALFK
jgi:hypothetical protein